MSKARWLIGGVVFGAAVVAPACVYLFVRSGGLSMNTRAEPLPFEKDFVHLALRANLGQAAKEKNPLRVTDDNLLAGARIYRQNCSMCHGLPRRPRPAIGSGEYPPPPQLFEPTQMVIMDPEGVTYWKVSNGIRFSGMPGFADTLSSLERWQVTMVLANANNLSANVIERELF